MPKFVNMRNSSRDKVTPPVIRIIITVFDIVVFVDIHRNESNTEALLSGCVLCCKRLCDFSIYVIVISKKKTR